MGIAWQELTNWTAVGTKDAAERTYNSVKAALDSSPALKGRSFDVFLQGSYANATNLRGDSDVDVVAMLTSTYVPDTTHLSVPERAAYERDRIPATYLAADFRRDVQAALQTYYGAGRVEPKNKCLRVHATQGYVDADVVPALEHRLYTSYAGQYSGKWIEGIRIYPLRGDSIVNYPKEHIRNGQAKNQRCAARYKPTVRQVKHVRLRAESEGSLREGEVPGYLLECMVYNVSDGRFVAEDATRVAQVLGELAAANLSALYSCDGVHHLFVDDPGRFDANEARRIIQILRETIG